MAKPRKKKTAPTKAAQTAPPKAAPPKPIVKIVEKLVETPGAWARDLAPTDAQDFANDLLRRFRDIMPDADFDTVARALLLDAWSTSKRTGSSFIAAKLTENIQRVRRGLGL